MAAVVVVWWRCAVVVVAVGWGCGVGGGGEGAPPSLPPPNLLHFL